MRILLSWLRDFVDVPGAADEVASTMSLRGFAVEGLERLDGDEVIDFEVTSNRPDCLCVLGIAREVATAYALPLREPRVPAGPAPDGCVPSAPTLAVLQPVDRAEDLDIVIEQADLCPRYAGAVADVRVGPSPEWMQRRLRAAGIRPISNIVDITNYVLLELGQPMHAFDLARLAGRRIRVRCARPGEAIRTLDGQVRRLAPDMLVIADAERPVAIAGVMGGVDSEVSEATTSVVFESAYFDARSVRRTSRALGLKTEASIRFERGADPAMAVTAIARACALLDAIGAGRARGTVVDRYPRPIEPRTVRLRRARVSSLLGVHVPDADVRRVLDGLGFVLHGADEGWDVTVPTRRVDVAREVDLIEEVARHVGYERVPASFPPLTAPAPPTDPRIVRARQLRTVLTGAGFFEAATFGFISEAAASAFAPPDRLARIRNPLSDNFSVLRPSILPGLIDAVAHNRRREQRDVRLFEIGSVFSLPAGERRAVALAWTGAAAGEHWSGGRREVDFFDMKGAVERLCRAMRVNVEAIARREVWLVEGRSAAIVCNGECVGVFGQLAPAVADRQGLPAGEAVYVAELDLDALEARAPRADVKVEPLPRYPSVTRDISILVDEALSSASIRATIRDAAPATLVRIREFDRYQGRGIPEGKVSLSLHLTFRSPDRTLTDEEVQQAMTLILARLTERHGAIQR